MSKNYGLPFHPHPGALRAVVCADGTLCPKVQTGPTTSGVTAGAIALTLDREHAPCGPHRVLAYDAVAYTYPDYQEKD